MIYDSLGVVQPPSTWFDSGCGGPRARWLLDGRIEIEGQGTLTTGVPPGVGQWGALIAKASAKYDVPAQLVVGVMSVESKGDPKALSYAGAAGLMQLMPATADYLAKRKVSSTEIFEPSLNVDLGVKYVRELWDRYKGNPIKIAAGYNAGSVKCGAPGKCPDGPNQWNVITDCASGKAVDYPAKMFAYSNAAVASGVGTSSATNNKGASWLPVAAGIVLVAGATVLLVRSA